MRRRLAPLLVLALLAPAWPAQAALLPPDLVVTAPGLAPGVPDEGASVTFNATLANEGDGVAVDFAVAFYVDGALFDLANLTAAAPGEAVNVTSRPWAAQPGSHELRVVADPDGRVEESNETNNEARLAFEAAPRPDLRVAALDLDPAQPTAGRAVQVTARVANDGHAAAGPSHVRLLADDQEVRNASVPALGPGEAVDVTATWNATQGDHVLTARADWLGEVAEADEANNDATRQVSVAAPVLRANLVLADLSWDPPAPSQGDAVRFRALVRNTGDADAAASTTGFAVDGQPLGPGATPALAPNASVWVTSQPWQAVTGEHAVQALADAAQQVEESDEADNTRGGAVHVAAAPAPADLVLDELSAEPAEPVAGEGFALRAVVRNAGARDAGPFDVAFRLDDRDAGTVRVAGLAAGASASVTGPDPLDAEAGNHTARATADSAGEVPEGAEGNNAADLALRVAAGALPPAPRPDLVLERVELGPADAQVGRPAHLLAVVANAGTAPSPATTLDFRLDGEPLGDLVELPALEPGARATVRSPSFMGKAGPHDASARADPEERVAELSEGNNRAALRFDIAAGLAASGVDVEVTALRLDPAPRAGEATSVVATVRNAGSTPLHGLDLRLRVDGLDAGGAPLPDLAPGAQADVRIAWQAEAGQHVLRARVEQGGTPVGKDLAQRVTVPGGEEWMLPAIVLVATAVVLSAARQMRRRTPR